MDSERLSAVHNDFLEPLIAGRRSFRQECWDAGSETVPVSSVAPAAIANALKDHNIAAQLLTNNCIHLMYSPNSVTLLPGGNRRWAAYSWEIHSGESCIYRNVISCAREYSYQSIIAKGGYRDAWQSAQKMHRPRRPKRFAG